MKIMIVDDEKLLRNGFRYMTNWAEKGVTIVGDAINGQDALDKLPLLQPDIVISDIKMPVMDGVTLVKEIKRLYPHISIVMLSSHDDYDYVRESMRLGASDYLLKATIDVNELYDILQRLYVAPSQGTSDELDTCNSENSLTVAHTTSSTQLIKSIIQYIEEHYTENISLSSIAKTFFMNKNYLCNLFKTETETTINEYIASLRIEKAKSLMRAKTTSLSQISYQVGYQNHTYFDRVFKRKTGFSPSEYMKLYR